MGVVQWAIVLDDLPPYTFVRPLNHPLGAPMPENASPEHVYVENEWYDGPRAGVADVFGQPHRFKSLFDEEDDQYLGTFLIWPIGQEELKLEVEQWRIFAKWDALRDAGKAGTETHPGHGGISPRWDEIESRLRTSRITVPEGAARATAVIEHIDGQCRYEPTGPAYKLRWKLV